MSPRLTRRTLLRSAALASAAHAAGLPSLWSPRLPKSRAFSNTWWPLKCERTHPARSQSWPPSVMGIWKRSPWTYLLSRSFARCWQTRGSVAFRPLRPLARGPTGKVSTTPAHWACATPSAPVSSAFERHTQRQASQKKINSLDQDDFKRLAEQANHIGEAARQRGIHLHTTITTSSSAVRQWRDRLLDLP